MVNLVIDRIADTARVEFEQAYTTNADREVSLDICLSVGRSFRAVVFDYCAAGWTVKAWQYCHVRKHYAVYLASPDGGSAVWLRSRDGEYPPSSSA